MTLRFHTGCDHPGVGGRSWITGIVVVVIIWIQPAAWAEGPAASNRLTVATFNVENMLDVFDDPYSLDEKTRVKPRQEVEQVAGAILTTRADVVALQEVEHEGMLRVMVHDLLADAGYENIAVMPTNSDYGANLGVISRYPILSLTSHRMMDLRIPPDPRVRRFARDLLQVRIQITPARTLDLFIVHFKSGRDPESALWRLAEATASRRVILEALERDPEAWVLLAGDCNDTPRSATLRTLLQTPRDQSSLLIDVHAPPRADGRSTGVTPDRLSTIDYLLASPAMARCLVPRSARIVRASDHRQLGSDHAPVVATFLINDEP